MFARVLVLLFALVLTACESNRGCGSRSGEPSDCERAEGAPTDQEDESSDDESDEVDSSADSAADAAADPADAGATQLTPDNTQAEFSGYPCTVDCSGHEAGYQWAQQHGIYDPDRCGGNSNSFIEGCRAWAEGADAGQDLDEDEQSDTEEEE